MRKPSLLWFLSKWPLPAQDGSRVASSTLLRELAKKGVDIDVVVLTAEESTIPVGKMAEDLGLRSITSLPVELPECSLLRRLLRHLTRFISDPLLPITTQRFATPETRRKIRRFLDKPLVGEPERAFTFGSPIRDWQVIVYEGVHTAVYQSKWGAVTTSDIPYIYRAQNREAQLWTSRARIERNPLLKGVLLFQGMLMKRLEDSLVRSATAVAAISSEDLEEFTKSSSSGLLTCIPVGLPFEDFVPASVEDPLRVLFVGKLDWYPNRDGLEWFLQEVWPRVSKERKNAELTIVGSGNGSWLSRFQSLNNLRIVGYVAELKDYYRDAHLAIVPIRYGGGVKVKAIEAAQCARVSLITPRALPGLCLRPGESILVGDTASEWCDLLISSSCSYLSQLGEAAYCSGKSFHCPERAAESFLNLINESLGRNEC